MIFQGEEPKQFKILVVGDKDVGKTSFVHLVCHGEPGSNPQWTIGCNVQLLVCIDSISEGIVTHHTQL
mgnify:CR=1 FL=1